jgi:hypothetical protein
MFIIILITARDWAVSLTSWVLSTLALPELPQTKHTLLQNRGRFQDIYAGTLSMGWLFILVSTELSRLLFKFQIIICVLNSKTLYSSVSGSRRR